MMSLGARRCLSTLNSTFSRGIHVAVIGGSVVGSSVAFNLAQRGAKVTVFEKDPRYHFASAPLSAGGFRTQFSNKVNIALSMYSVDFVKNVNDHLLVDDPIDLVFKENGYLFLASSDGEPILRENHAVQTSMDADVELLTPSQLASEYPWLETDGIALGAIGRSMEGWIDPYMLLMALKAKSRQLGVEYLASRVVALERGAGGKVSSIIHMPQNTLDNLTLKCDAVVNCAGPNAGKISSMLDISLPVVPRKRFVFSFSCNTPIPKCPLVVDPSGAYFRPESSGLFICGTSPAMDEDIDCDPSDFDVQYELFESLLWPALATRVPAFEQIKEKRSWAGHYDFNTFDQNAIIGPHPDVTNFFFANGFSGHGLQQSPAVGKVISEMVLDGESHTLDVSALSYERIAAEKPVLERNIV